MLSTFATGRFTGDSIARRFDFRFDPQFGLVSGEVLLQSASGSPHDVSMLIAEFLAAEGEPAFDSTRRTTWEISSDGNTLTLRREEFVVKLTRPAANPTVLELEYTRSNLFPDSATLHQTSVTLFRTLQLEVDRVAGTDPLPTFPHQGRLVSLEECYRNAGVDVTVNNANQFQVPAGVTPETWDDGELGQVLSSQFQSFDPQQEPMSWRGYLLIATRYEEAKFKTRGILFDVKRRRGAAVFSQTIKELDSTSSKPWQARLIRTAVHEVGHAFNLLHTEDPRSGTTGSASLSFMNRPDLYIEGPTAYWNQFDFSFEDAEKRWLRHGKLSQLVMGGDEFRGNSSADQENAVMLADHPNLKLELRVRPRRAGQPPNGEEGTPIFEFGEPVYVEAKLSLHGDKPLKVPDTLDPNLGQLVVWIRKPDGGQAAFRPLLYRCASPAPVRLHPKTRPALYADVFLGYGADGFPFLAPGQYVLTALFDSGNGLVRSRPLSLWVRFPTREQENLVVPMFDDEVGQFLALGGGLHLERAISRYEQMLATPTGADHTLAVAFRARLLLQKSRGFKRIVPARGRGRRKLTVLPPEPDEQGLIGLLGLGSNERASALSNIFFGRVASVLWHLTRRANKKKEAEEVKRHTLRVLREEHMKPATERDFRKQAFPS